MLFTLQEVFLLLAITRSKGNKKIKFGQLITQNMKDFSRKITRKTWGRN